MSTMKIQISKKNLLYNYSRKKKVIPYCVQVALTAHHKLLWRDDCMQLLIYFNFLYSVFKLDNNNQPIRDQVTELGLLLSESLNPTTSSHVTLCVWNDVILNVMDSSKNRFLVIQNRKTERYKSPAMQRLSNKNESNLH